MRHCSCGRELDVAAAAWNPLRALTLAQSSTTPASVIYPIDAATESRECWSVKAPVPSSAPSVEVFESRNILILVVDRCPFHHFRTCIAPLVPCDLVALAVQNPTVRLSERPCARGRRAPVQGRCSPDFLCSRSLPNCPGRRQPLKPSGQARGPSRVVFAEGVFLSEADSLSFVADGQDARVADAFPEKGPRPARP
jgi:hypothetical protein